MVKKLQLTLIALVTFAAQAATVSEQQAQQLAAQFFGTAQLTQAARPALALKAKKTKGVNNNTAAYYVFNNNTGGWVIIAGDDRARTVLAYNDEGNFNPATIDDNTQWLLDSYAEIINNLTPDMGSTYVDAPATGKQAIKPLLTCMWGQTAPFNFQCPYYKEKRCPTGCVATAIAQVMYYYKWPQHSPEIRSYTPRNNDLAGEFQEELPATDFDWSLMKDFYSRDETDETDPSNAEVAKLMHYVGQAMSMNYGGTVSGATTSQTGLVTFFDYDPKATMVGRTEYTSETWADLLYNELAAKRPIIFAGDKWSGGHAFLCDGYDGKGLFHINWGWYGSSNGYYSVDVLNANGGGTGSINGPDGYVVNLRAVIGIQPYDPDSTEPLVNGIALTHYGSPLVEDFQTSATVTRSSTDQNFTATFIAGYYNLTNTEYVFDYGWGIFNSDNALQSTIINESGKTFGPWSTIQNFVKRTDFGANITKGTLYFRPMYRASEGGEWKQVIGAGENYIRVDIEGNTCKLTGLGDETEGNISVNNVTFNGTLKVGHLVEVEADVVSHTGCDFNKVFLTVDGVEISVNTTVLPAGGTGKAYIHIVPTEAGTKEIKLYSDRICRNLLYTTSVTIDESPEADLSFSTTIDGITEQELNSTTAKITLQVQNNMAAEFDDIIIARLTKQLPDELYYRNKDQVIACRLDANGNATLNASFSDLEVGERYMLIPFYYSQGKLMQGEKSISFLVNGQAVDDKFDVNGDGEVNVGDVSAIYAVILGTDNTFAAHADVNGDGEINVGDISEIYKAILSK